MKRTTKHKLFGDVKLRREINKFFVECAREVNRLHIEQGKRFDEKFPNVQKLKTLTVSDERELTGVDIIRLAANLKGLGVHPSVVTAYLAGFVDFNEFLRLVGKAVQTSQTDTRARMKSIRFAIASEVQAIKKESMN